MFLSQDCSGLEMFVRQWLSQSDPVRPLRQVHQHCCLVLARVCTTSDGRAAAKIAATNCGLWTITKLVSEWVQKKSAVFLKGFSVVMWQRSGIGVFFRGVACTRICRFTENGSTGFWFINYFNSFCCPLIRSRVGKKKHVQPDLWKFSCWTSSQQKPTNMSLWLRSPQPPFASK